MSSHLTRVAETTLEALPGKKTYTCLSRNWVPFADQYHYFPKDQEETPRTIISTYAPGGQIEISQFAAFAAHLPESSPILTIAKQLVSNNCLLTLSQIEVLAEMPPRETNPHLALKWSNFAFVKGARGMAMPVRFVYRNNRIWQLMVESLAYQLRWHPNDRFILANKPETAL